MKKPRTGERKVKVWVKASWLVTDLREYDIGSVYRTRVAVPVKGAVRATLVLPPQKVKGKD